MKTDADTAKIIRNLKDAGCNASFTAHYLQLGEQGRREEQMRILRLHRCTLLKKVHDNQKRIDCLDYFIYHFDNPNS